MALPTSPPVAVPITAPPIGLKPVRLAIRPPVMPPATAPIPVRACCREPGAPQLAIRPLAPKTTRVLIEDRDVIAPTPGYDTTSSEYVAAVALRLILSLPVLQRCIGCKTRRSIGQGRERKIDVADEADVAVPGRRTAGLRALLLDEFRKLVAGKASRAP
jgi:hypothetical protein